MLFTVQGKCWPQRNFLHYWNISLVANTVKIPRSENSRVVARWNRVCFLSWDTSCFIHPDNQHKGTKIPSVIKKLKKSNQRGWPETHTTASRTTTRDTTSVKAQDWHPIIRTLGKSSPQPIQPRSTSTCLLTVFKIQVASLGNSVLPGQESEGAWESWFRALPAEFSLPRRW